jgi:hypothetical protein
MSPVEGEARPGAMAPPCYNGVSVHVRVHQCSNKTPEGKLCECLWAQGKKEAMSHTLGVC